MELAWLVHQVEQRYGVELADDQLERINTIDDAVRRTARRCWRSHV